MMHKGLGKYITMFYYIRCIKLVIKHIIDLITDNYPASTHLKASLQQSSPHLLKANKTCKVDLPLMILVLVIVSGTLGSLFDDFGTGLTGFLEQAG